VDETDVRSVNLLW